MADPSPAACLALGAALGIALGAAATWCRLGRQARRLRQELEVARTRGALHWKPDPERRGLGDLLHKVNHIALIVQDVGDSLFFYTDIIGFQQIRRPNFDRHGAWLTMGNIELHLIKGQPMSKRGAHPADLIVSHIALEVTDVEAVLQRLRKLHGKYRRLHWRQNISVPTPEQSRAMKFESDHTSADGKVVQFFLEDPDGYWLEICNCDVLTKFCFEQEEDDHHGLRQYVDGGERMRRVVRAGFPVLMRSMPWVDRARRSLVEQKSPGFVDRLRAGLRGIPPEAVSEEHLTNLVHRKNTYGDLCQAFDLDALRGALAEAGGSVPTAMLLLKHECEVKGHMAFKPPNYISNSDHAVETNVMPMPVASRWTDWAKSERA